MNYTVKNRDAGGVQRLSSIFKTAMNIQYKTKTQVAENVQLHMLKNTGITKEEELVVDDGRPGK